MKKVEVTIGGPVSGDVSIETLEELGDELMSALVELDAEDPFVSVDGEKMWLHVQLVVTAMSGSQALALGSDLMARALAVAGCEEVPVDDDLVTNASTRVLEPA